MVKNVYYLYETVSLLGSEKDVGEIENAHRTGRKREEKPRNIIVKLYSRPFKRVLLRVAKNQENKQALNGGLHPLRLRNPGKSTPD